MKLLIDVGNTSGVFGLWYRGEVLEKWRLPTDVLESEDQMFVVLKELIGNAGYTMEQINSLCIASVVPRLKRTFNYFDKKYFKQQPVFVSAVDGIGIRWDADNPWEIGADRVANVIGATEYHGDSSIVLDFGTAITVDIIFKNAFVGGSILPGPMTSMKALFSSTAKLPEVDLFFEDHYLGTNTGDNLRIGIINGTYHALEGIVREVKKEIGNLEVIATGGHAETFMIEESFIDKYDPELTLKGIAAFDDRVKKLEKNIAG